MDQEAPPERGAIGAQLFCRCNLFDRRSFDFGLLALFIGFVQEPIDDARTLLLLDPSVLRFLLFSEENIDQEKDLLHFSWVGLLYLISQFCVRTPGSRSPEWQRSTRPPRSASTSSNMAASLVGFAALRNRHASEAVIAMLEALRPQGEPAAMWPPWWTKKRFQICG